MDKTHYHYISGTKETAGNSALASARRFLIYLPLLRGGVTPRLAGRTPSCKTLPPMLTDKPTIVKLTKDTVKQIPDGYGIYKIYVRTSDNVAIEITRFAAVDTTGLIYIGRAGRQKLRKRLSNFEITRRQGSKTTNHSGAMKYKNFLIIQQTLRDNHDLYFEYEICSNPELREKELLNNYRSIFGDTPLLNG
jgi:hypothetical protein